MTWNKIQGPIEGPLTSVTVNGTVAGNYLLAFVNDNGGASPRAEPTGMTVNAGAGPQLTWTKIISVEGSFPVFGSYYRHTWFVSSAIPASIAGNMTVQVVPSNFGTKQAILEFSAGAPTIHIDATVSSNQIGTSNPPTATLPTTEPNGLIVSAITSSHAHPGIGAGYIGIPFTNSSSFQEGEYDLDHGASGNIVVAYTGSVNTSLITAFSLQEDPLLSTANHRFFLNF